MTHTKFIPSHSLNIKTEEWQEIASVYKNRNFLQMQGFVKIISIVDDIYMIVWDYDGLKKELYKGIVE